jgi:predicted TIM-barrel fold metal-dependent hydrolase
MTKLWANSADSHFLEPDGLWEQVLPPAMAARMPHTVREGDIETVTVDGTRIERRVPRPGLDIGELASRPPGARDVRARLVDLDEEGIWGEVVFPSVGMWANLIQDPALMAAAVRGLNDWSVAEIQGYSDRLVVAASVSLLDIGDAVTELRRMATLGVRALFLPTMPPKNQAFYNDDRYEPLWAAAAEAGMLMAFHIGTDGETVLYRGSGGAVLNYVETSYGGQRVVTALVSAGVLDRHPALRVLVAEGGGAWPPILGDRMNEGYRQHGMFVRPKLSMNPKEFIERQVFASFQHDETAIPALTAMGYRNVLWGSDYPHLEGTFGHTQSTLKELTAGVAPDVRRQVLVGNFQKLFPHVPAPPADEE